jgi:hypothetical protein
MFWAIISLGFVVLLAILAIRISKNNEKHRLACKQLANEHAFIKTYSGSGRFIGVTAAQICLFNTDDASPLFVDFTALRGVEMIINGERHLATDIGLKTKINSVAVHLLTNDMTNPMYAVQFFPLPYLDVQTARLKANEFIQVVQIGLQKK